MRFIGAVHVGVDRIRREPGRRRERARRRARVPGVGRRRGLVRGPRARRLGARRAVLAFVPAVAMAQVLPISLSGLGIREGLLVLLLHPLGVPTGKAIGVGLLWYGMTLVVSLLGAPAVRGRAPRRQGTATRRRGRRRRPTPRSPGPRSHHERRRARSTTTRVVDPTRPRRRKLRGGRRLRDGHYLYWWVELLAVLVFYFVYSTIRNLHHGNAAEAFQHAQELIPLQRDLGINHEQAIQDWALGWRPLIIAANYFYGSLHFIVTGGVMIYLYRKWTDDYPLWRNTLAVATGARAHRLRAVPAHAAAAAPRFCNSSPGFVPFDTLAKDPAFWSFNSGAVNKISNQFAAMPSVHCAWALWCACALVPRLKHWWAKVLAAIYPVTTVTVIVVTANHYFLDAVGGFLVLGIGYLAARAFTRAGRGHGHRRRSVAVRRSTRCPTNQPITNPSAPRSRSRRSAARRRCRRRSRRPPRGC